MRAILLAGGLGTRLRPLTYLTPKCLVPINGVPLLEIWLKKLTESSVNNFLINTHYLFDQVENYIDSSPYKQVVTLSHEPILLGTAGTLINNLDFFESQDGMLIHADNYCLADFSEFIQSHHNRPSHCMITMMTFHTDNPSTCGIVKVDDSNTVVEFHEKVNTPKGNIANGAIYILSGKFQKILRKEFSAAEDFSTEILPNFIGHIHTYQTNKIFLDIGTPEMYAKANNNNEAY